MFYEGERVLEAKTYLGVQVIVDKLQMDASNMKRKEDLEQDIAGVVEMNVLLEQLGESLVSSFEDEEHHIFVVFGNLVGTSHLDKSIPALA